MAAGQIPIKLFLAVFLALTALQLGEVALIRAGLTDRLMIIGIIRVGQIAALVFLTHRIAGGLDAIRFSPSGWKSGAVRGCIWSAGFGAVVITGFGILALAGIDPLELVRMRVPASGMQITLYLCVGGIIGPIAEEMVFRGIVYGFFRGWGIRFFGKWGILIAAIVSSLAFFGAHSHAGFTQAVGGILFVFAYEMEKNLMVPIIIHVLGNITIFLLALVC